MARRNAVHEKITCKKAPMPVGPYAQAVRVVQPGEMIFVSGQIPIEGSKRTSLPVEIFSVRLRLR